MAFTFAGQYTEVILGTSSAGFAVALPSLSVHVYTVGTTTHPTLYTSRTKGTTTANPTTTDVNGNLTFFVDPGQYDIVFTPPGGSQKRVTVTVPTDPAESSAAYVTRPDAATNVPVIYVSKASVASDANDGLTWATAKATTTAAYAAMPTNGGRAMHGYGTFPQVADTIVPTGVTTEGCGKNLTELAWTTDAGSGHYALDASAAGSQWHAPAFRDLMVTGPGVRGALGTSPCNMDGIRLGPNQHMEDVYAHLFHAGIVLNGDHNTLSRVKSSDNYYNVLFPDSPATLGNQTFLACELDGALFACIAVAGSNIMDTVTFVGGHGGFAPYVFYKFDGTSVSTQGFFKSCVLENFSFEAVGNSAILDESTGSGSGQDSFNGTRIENPGFAFSNTYKIAARAQDWAVKVRNVLSLHYRDGGSGFTAGSIGAFFWTGLAAATLDMGRGGVPANCFGSGSTWASAGNLGELKVIGGAWRGFVAFCNATIAAGDVLRFTGGSYQVGPHDGSTSKGYAGVATTAGVSGGPVVVAQEGICTITSESATAGQLLSLLPGTGKRVQPAPNLTGAAAGTSGADNMPIIAVATINGGAGGGSGLRCLLTKQVFQPGYVNPATVAALPTAAAAYRGQLLRVNGDGSTTADVLSVCLQSATGTYSWKTLATG